MSTDPVVRVSNLVKKFEKKEPVGGGYSARFKNWLKPKTKTIYAVDDISFELKKGEILGILGPNGAGKTTALNCISTLYIPDSGKITIMGLDAVKDEYKVREILGMPMWWYSGRFSLDKTLWLTGRYFGVPKQDLTDKIEKYLTFFNLQEKRNDEYQKLSTGMKAAVNTMVPLIRGNKIILLDEPTNGLDPIMAEEYRKLILNLAKKEGHSFLYTSHIMRDIEQLCKRILILYNGKIIAEGSLEKLKRKAREYEVITIKPAGNLKDLIRVFKNEVKTAEIVKLHEGTIKILTHNGDATLNEIAEITMAKRLKTREILLAIPTAEDVFIYYTMKAEREKNE